MRTNFPCGHNGKGRYCHLCKQLESGELSRYKVRLKDKPPKTVYLTSKQAERFDNTRGVKIFLLPPKDDYADVEH